MSVDQASALGVVAEGQSSKAEVGRAAVASAISRRRVLKGLAGLALLPNLGACFSTNAKPLNVAVQPTVGSATLFLARDQGWIDPRRVCLVNGANSCDALQKLREGQADAAILTLAETLLARAMGVPLTVAMVCNVSVGADMLLVRPGVRTLAGLKGLRIGYDPCSVNELLLAEILREAGLSRNVVTLAEEPVAEQLACWQARDVDAMLCNQPVASQLQAMGAVRLFDSRQLPDLLVDVLVLHEGRLAGRGEAVRQLVDGQLRAVRHLHRNPQDANYRVANLLGMQASEVHQAQRGLLFADAANNARQLVGVTPTLLGSAERLSSLMVSHQLLPAPDSLKSLIRPDFLPTESDRL